MDDGSDWLEGDAEGRRAEQRALAIEFARNYQIFTDSERGRAIWEHWTNTYLSKTTPTESSLQRYAADNAVREFINGIKRQLDLANEQV